MSVPSQGGLLSFGLQPAKYGESGTYNEADIQFYKMRAPRIAIGPIQDQQIFPLEVGGAIVPTGVFKQAAFGAGQIDLIPRLENSIGFILKAVMGSSSSVTGKDADGNTLAGVNSHIFRFDPTSSYTQSWCAVRRIAPASDPSNNRGETVYDAKVSGIQVTIPAMGKVSCRVGMVGRQFKAENNPAWSYANATFEDSSSTADAGRGQFKIGGVAYPIIGATIDMQNSLTNPQQEMVIGSFHPDDFVALSRGATIRIVYKVSDYELYNKVFTNASLGTTWDSLPFIVNSSGGTYAFDARFQAPANIPSTSTPYELRIRANRVTWQVEGPIELQAGGIVTQTFVGTVLDADTSDYLQFTVSNAATSY